MLKGIQWFMERLVERVVPIVASSFMSTIQTQHALGQAEQQDQLEEAARRYETEGKTDVAARLRERAASLTATSPGEEAVRIFESLASEQHRLLPPGADTTDATVGQPELPSRKRPGKAPRKRPMLPEPERDN